MLKIKIIFVIYSPFCQGSKEITEQPESNSVSFLTLQKSYQTNLWHSLFITSFQIKMFFFFFKVNDSKAFIASYTTAYSMRALLQHSHSLTNWRQRCQQLMNVPSINTDALPKNLCFPKINSWKVKISADWDKLTIFWTSSSEKSNWQLKNVT